MKINILDHGHHHVFIGKHRFCARCLGTYGIGAVSFIIALWLYMIGLQYSFWSIFILSWVLAGICLFDWLSIKLKLREGSNGIRFISGACLGIAYSMYIWLLPIPWFTKLVSLAIINSSFAVIVYYVRCKEHNVSLLEPARLMEELLFEHKRTYCCEPCSCCGSASCCCCGMEPIVWVVGCVLCGALCCICCTVGVGSCCAKVPK